MSGQPSRSAEDLAQQLMPSVLEMQKLIVERAAGAASMAEVRRHAVSITSCDSNSCNGGSDTPAM